MERLTEKYEEYSSRFPKDVKENKKGYSINSEIVYEKLGAYEDLEEQGLLLKLPCKVGDTIYTIYSDEDGSFIEKPIVEDVSTHRIWIHSMFFDYSDIGKTVFLTQAEAEDALNRMERFEGGQPVPSVGRKRGVSGAGNA